MSEVNQDHHGPFLTHDEAASAENVDAHLQGDWWIAPIYPMD